MASITSSIDLLYLIKTSWCRWIIVIEESLILLVCPFSFNILLYTCLQVRERYSILLVALEILINSAPMLLENILLGILEQSNGILTNNLVWNSSFLMQIYISRKEAQKLLLFVFFSSNSFG